MNLIAKVDENEAIKPQPFRALFTLDKRLFESVTYLEDRELLEKLVFNIARKPRHLLSHVQRIYLCYKNSWSDQLFAALADFMFVLNGRGRAISQRLLFGAKSGLTKDQVRILQDVSVSGSKASRLSAYQYSIFSKGLEGTDVLVQQAGKTKAVNYDPLDIARDHIEYSQLEEAKQVLEQAIFADPDRAELQQELLGLYRSTRDNGRFMQMLDQMQQFGYALTDGWDSLQNFFKGQEDNG